jgi:hypothetical protein
LWRQIGSGISCIGYTASNSFGSALLFLADGDVDDEKQNEPDITIIKTAYMAPQDADTGLLQVQAYTYHTEADEWHQPSREQ